MTAVAKVVVVLLLMLADVSRVVGKPRQLKPGCRYEGRRYQEGTAVSTSEPCLQCRCTEGALRCRLRVCPRLPNPPPSGCRVRPPGENVCCAELICGTSHLPDSENMLRRANVQIEEEADEEGHFQHSRSEGCLHEGVRYAPGSAMMGSRRCEYCYCISGARRCIRPKCLLPLPGCSPLYAPHSCCPVAYNCTHLQLSTSPPLTGNGCRVGDRAYREGEMVRDIEWKGTCDNCFCAMGAVRCIPLSCAPPLQGCTPIVREGQCCPSTYNCSGSIEVKATQNYASFAFVSKDYAKFRKETNFFPIPEHTTIPPVEGRGHRVPIDEPLGTATVTATTTVTAAATATATADIFDEESSITTESTSWPSTVESDSMDNEILVETMDYTKSTTEATVTTTTTTASTTIEQLSTEELSTNTESPTSRSTDSIADSTTACSPNEHTVTESTAIVTEEMLSSTEEAAISSSTELTAAPADLISDNATDKTENRKEEEEEEEEDEKEEEKPNPIETIGGGTTRPPILFANSSSAVMAPSQKMKGERHANKTTAEVIVREAVTSSPSSAVVMPDDMMVMNVTVKTNVSVGHIQGVTINPIRSIPPDVEAILNITHRVKGEEYEYDYSEPTLPPSLPNVRIIPFVAADALVKDKDVSAVTGYPSGSVVVPPELRPTDTSAYYDIATQENRFSPPVETEGGFVPREPPYFDAPYHSTDLNLEIGTGVTVIPASITSPHRKTNDLSSNCLFENLEYRHGEIVPSRSMCMICMCYYGEVVCSSEKCPPLKIGCRRIDTDEGCCGKIVCVEAEESPTVVLDRADASALSQRKPTVSPDPFRDVIKTEPAPDLPSLIEDMIPYLVEHGITTLRPTKPTTLMTPMTPMTPTATKPVQNQGMNQLRHKFNSFNFMENLSLMRPSFDYREGTMDGAMPLSNKYLSHELPPKKPVSLMYDLNDPDRTMEVGPETDAIVYDKVTLTRLDQVTSRPKEEPSANQTKPNVTGNDVNQDDKETAMSIAERYNSTQSSSTAKTSEDLEDPIFSLDSVLDLLFASDDSKSRIGESTKSPEILPSTTLEEHAVTGGTEGSSTSGFEGSSTGSETSMATSSKILDNEIPTSVASLLKLAGCNIYGRMYRVGRIITELSGPCLECRCTEIGVQCKQLEC